MIVKDEEACIEKSIRSIKDYVDDLVIVDTGSCDRTREIALENGARVFDFAWCNDFSKARNYAASKALYDWIFVLDADEAVVKFDKQSLFEAMKNPNQVGSIQVYEIIDSKIHSSHTLSRFYNKGYYHFAGKIHEQLKQISAGQTHHKYVELPIWIEHYGYEPEVMLVKEKFERNESILLEEIAKHPNEPYLHYQQGKNNFVMSKDLKKACLAFEKALQLKPNLHLEYVYSLVECYGYALINTGQFKKALELTVYASVYQGNPSFRFLLAHIYQNNGMFIEAVESYESCIGAAGDDYRGITSYLSNYNIGVILECIHMPVEAREYYLKCGSYQPALERLSLLV